MSNKTPLGRFALDAGPVQPFNDSTSIRLATGNPALTPVEECRHSYIKASGADRWRCPHCGAVFIFSE